MKHTHSLVVEDSPLTPFLKKLTVYTSGGPFLDGYILTIIGMALLQLEPQLHLDTFWTGLIGAAALVGLLVGGIIFGYVTDLTINDTMMISTIITFLGLMVCVVWAPETKGLTLKEASSVALLQINKVPDWK